MREREKGEGKKKDLVLEGIVEATVELLSSLMSAKCFHFSPSHRGSLYLSFRLLFCLQIPLYLIISSSLISSPAPQLYTLHPLSLCAISHCSFIYFIIYFWVGWGSGF